MTRREYLNELDDICTKAARYDEIVATRITDRPTEHWEDLRGILQCPFCKCRCYPMEIENGDYNYCPNCGAYLSE